MERYKLNELYSNLTLFNNALIQEVDNFGFPMGLVEEGSSEVLEFVGSSIYGYFFEDLVAYEGENLNEVKGIFTTRLIYDIWSKLPYWYRKYNEIKKLLTSDDFSMLQTSKVTSSSQDLTKSAGGSLQKGATTPTGISDTASEDEFALEIIDGSDNDNQANINTTGFADKYTNHQQKFANANRVEGERSGSILREGSIKDLVEVLEKLPSSFADEVSRELSKHFIFDYDGERKGYYNETN